MIIIRRPARFASSWALQGCQLTEMSEQSGPKLTEMSEQSGPKLTEMSEPHWAFDLDVRAFADPDVRTSGLELTEMSEHFRDPWGQNWPRCPNKRVV